MIAFLQNDSISKIIILPFLICAFAKFFETLFIMLKKEKASKVFRIIFRLSFFLYYFGFLLYVVYYSIVNKEYSLILFSLIFWYVGIKTCLNLRQKNKK